MRSLSVCKYKVDRMKGMGVSSDWDTVAVEAPLQMIVRHGKMGTRTSSPLAMTMRTPGQDEDLVYGYLFSQNIIQKKDDIFQIRWIEEGLILAELDPKMIFDSKSQERQTWINSACGICGKTHLEDLHFGLQHLLRKDGKVWETKEVLSWPQLLKAGQEIFHLTGGTHAAALIMDKQLVRLREDVGRHNALDKLLGSEIREISVPLNNAAIMVSARASYELVHKAIRAGVPLLAAVGATSSQAIELAEEHGMTLIAFLREDHFNIYSHPERIRL